MVGHALSGMSDVRMNASEERPNAEPCHWEKSSDIQHSVYDAPDGGVIEEEQWMMHTELHETGARRDRGDESCPESNVARCQRPREGSGKAWIASLLAVDVGENG